MTLVADLIEKTGVYLVVALSVARQYSEAVKRCSQKLVEGFVDGGTNQPVAGLSHDAPEP